MPATQNYEPQREERSTRLDDVAYLAPMAAFLALTWVGGKWQSLYAASYVAKTFLAAGLLIYFRRHYTRIRWDHWLLGIIVGVVGIVQWVGMEEILMKLWPNYPRLGGNVEPFKAHEHFKAAWQVWGFVAIRWAGAALVVPFMEELFWRDYLWRTVLAPNDFKLARIGEWDWKVFLGVAAFFATVHPMWMTAFVWGLLIGWLLIHTRSLGACIIAHGVTNFLLGLYVQWSGKWYYW